MVILQRLPVRSSNADCCPTSLICTSVARRHTICWKSLNSKFLHRNFGIAMPNIAVILKNEISRLSRKEVLKELQPLRKAVTTYRREIAALKRTIASLERRSKQIAKQTSSTNTQPVADETPTRFVAKGLVSLRKRLGLSAADLAKLLGVSMQSIYNWEHKKASPRKEQVTSIVALRSIGKKEVRERLDALSSLRRKTKNVPRKGHR